MQQTYITRPHYEILDGLRGVAALLVVWFHLTEFMNPGPMPLFHGYLAVDFFYVLSGFVIGYAYDGRWGKEMGLKQFLKRRLIRLQPLVFMGGVIGIMMFYFSDCNMFADVSKTEWWVLLLVGLASCFCIPLPPSFNHRNMGEVTSTNAPMWSLFYEYIANLLYALVVRRMGTWALAALVAAFGVMVVDSSLALNLFGTLEEHERQLSLNFGFKMTPEHCYVAMSRLLYPFFMGVLLSRIKNKGAHRASNNQSGLLSHGFLICSLLLSAVLLMPRMCGWEQLLPEGLFNMTSVLVLFPLIVALGAHSNLTGKRSSAFCKWMGELSYPLYITHYPFMYVFLAWWDRNRDIPIPTFIMVQIFVFILTIVVAWLAYKLYDIPLRRWLSEKL
ncbi:MAG: acyltransferase [Bacteroidales bacterium]|nr:acyltransferase [Bacteroidales bacterium]